MKPASRTAWARVVFTFLMTGMLGLSLMPRASAGDRGDIKKAQQARCDKGYNPAPVASSDFKGAGQALRTSGAGVGHEMKQDELIAVGKGVGEGLGEGGQDAARI